MYFSEDQDVSILYLSTKFELDRSTYNEDLSPEENKRNTQNPQTHTHIESETDSLLVYHHNSVG